MNWRPSIDDVLQDLCARDVQCGMATMPGGEMRAWIEVDGALIEGYFEATPTMSDQIAFWLRETGNSVRLPFDPVHVAFSDNVVDARPRFLNAAEHARQRRRSLLDEVTSWVIGTRLNA